MTIAISSKDAVYYPQFPAEIDLTINLPFREVSLCIVSTRCARSIIWNEFYNGDHYLGKSYLNVSDKEVWRCTSLDDVNQWEKTPLRTLDEGWVYYSKDQGTPWQWNFYEWRNGSISLLASRFETISVKLASMTDAPMMVSIYDLYFNPSDRTLSFWNGFSWEYAPYNTIAWSSTQDENDNGNATVGVTYTFGGIIYAMYLNSYLRPYFYDADVTLSLSGSMDQTYNLYPTLNGRNYTETVTLQYTGSALMPDVSCRANVNYGRTIPYTNGTQYEYSSYLYIRGQWGKVNPAIEVLSRPEYIRVKDNSIQIRTSTTPSSAYPGSFLIPRDAPSWYGMNWTIIKTAGPNCWTRTLPQAISEGKVALASQNILWNTSTIAIKFNECGTYTIRCEGVCREAIWNSTPTSWTVQVTGVVVYNQSTASVEIRSVTPYEYKEGVSDPLQGMPPYTVVWKDMSAIADPYQIPQAQVTYDFGDPETGTENVGSAINPGNSVFTAPDQTHVYNGYGAYTCRMTIIDKLGNETTASCQFAPSTAPRMIKRPTLTPQSGNQPLLVEGNAFVAGKPEPAATWSYELLGDDTGYYAGEKEGKFVEMSLLAGGQYAVKCDIVDVSGVTLETTNFTVNVTPDPLYQDNPVRMNNFDVWVYDEDGEKVDILQPASRARYADRYAHEKVCTFQVPSDYPYLQRLRKDCIIDFGYLGIARRMVVVSFVEESDGLNITIEAKDFASYIFGYRVATVATRSTSGNGKDIQRCSGEALLRYFVVANLNSALRDVPLLHLVGENLDRGGVVEYSARYDKTSDILDSICTSSGLGWDVSLQATSPESIGFKVVEGVDRTYSSENPIVFSGRIDGLRNADVGAFSEYSSPNVAIGAGAGDGATRDYAEYGETGFGGMLRREVFVDAGDSASAEEVRLTCLAKLKNLEDASIDVYPNADAQWKFGVDYNVGDYVTIETQSGILMDMQIVSAELSNYTGEGEVLLLKCGVDERTTRTILRELELGNTHSKK